MDIFNRPPGISEDTLQYSLYPSPESADKSSVTSLAALIEAQVKELIPDFIWHRDAFELKVVPDALSAASYPKGDNKWMLEGRMRVGDSVDDEWCVVWLLREVSKKWDVAVTVFDTDGEFLLIEAAEYLPSWVTPSNSENRVWLYHGNLHLIPSSYESAPSSKSLQRRRLDAHDSDEGDSLINAENDDGWLNLQDSLKALRSEDPTEAPKEVQEAVWRRIAGYPAAARQHLHVTKAFIPLDVAKALTKDPSLIQKAVETFYTRDAIQLRAAHKMSRFPPHTSVLSPVRMTRAAYAQLVGQKFHPPKIFGGFKEREGTREWRWRNVGMKVACGFEMLYQESKSKSDGMSAEAQKVSVEVRKDALRRKPDYVEYIKKLESTGYFRDEIEGSLLWNELEDKAAEVFVNTRRDDDASRPSFASLVNNAIAQSGENPTLPDWDEESDDWLNVDAESFDAKLAETIRPKGKASANKQDAMEVDQPTSVEDEENRVAQAQADKLKDLAKKVETFVEGEGTLEGAVFEDEKMSEDEELSEFSDEEFPSESEDNMQQDENEEENTQKAARQEAMDRLVPALDPGDYGKMPPEYYINSQRVAPLTMDSEHREDVNAQTSASHAASEDEGTVATTNAKPTANKPPPNMKSIRRPILPRDKFDGVDSDDETDEEDEEGSEESEEDRPQVVGEIEIDMDEEREEFLEFSRTALGISDEMWYDILQERKGRGAYVPEGMEGKQNRLKEQKVPPTQKRSDDEDKDPSLRPPQPGPRPNANPNLDSFEAVMEAMEAELSRARLAKNSSAALRPILANSQRKEPANPLPLRSSKGKGKGKAVPEDGEMDSEDEEIEAAMDTELRAALEREEGDSGDEEPMDYGMMKNFLESFKSQAGLSGPVSNLAGRLQPGWLPRDES